MFFGSLNSIDGWKLGRMLFRDGHVDVAAGVALNDSLQ